MFLALAALLAVSTDLGPVDAFVRAEMEKQKVPGVAVAIARGGEVLKAQGYGVANVEHQVPVKPETIFQSGSVGKQFTSAPGSSTRASRRRSCGRSPTPSRRSPTA